MKLKHQIKKLQEYLDADSRKRKAHREDMKALLHKMKLKEQELSEKALTQFDEDKRKRLHKEIDMLHAQRKKGIAALKALKA